MSHAPYRKSRIRTSLSAALAGIFFWHQVAWAGEFIERVSAMTDQTGVMEASRLETAQQTAESVIAAKEDTLAYEQDRIASPALCAAVSSLSYCGPARCATGGTSFMQDAGASGALVDFGVSGLWLCEGASWSRISPDNPQRVLADGDRAAADFGSLGLWTYDSAGWTQINAADPECMIASDIDANGQRDLIVDFGAEYGLWAWKNGATWERLNGADATSALSTDIDNNGRADLVVDFGAVYGIWAWMNDALWAQLNTASSECIISTDIDADGAMDLVIDFGPQYGLWARKNGSTWEKLNAADPDEMLSADIDGNGQADLVVDFGPAYGIWTRMNDTAWAKLNEATADSLIAADLDGNGQEDLVVDFGHRYGLWTWKNNTAWSKVNEASAEEMLAVDPDADGRDDVLVDFGSAYGMWALRDGPVWAEINVASPHVNNQIVSLPVTGPRAEYDERGRIMRRIDDDNSVTEYLCDADGALPHSRRYFDDGSFVVCGADGSVIYAYTLNASASSAFGYDTSVVTASGDTIYYESGTIRAVKRATDGSIIMPTAFGAGGDLENATILYTDGGIGVVYGGEMMQVALPSGALIRYRDGRVATEYTAAAGVASYSYRSADGISVDSIAVRTADAACFYDANGLPTQLMNGNGDVVFFAGGRITMIKTSAGPVYTYRTDGGEPVRSVRVERTDDRSVPETVVYGPDGRIAGMTNSAGEEVSFDEGLLTIVTGGTVASYRFETDGGTVSVRDDIRRVYDRFGRLTSFTQEGSGVGVAVDPSSGAPSSIKLTDGLMVSASAFGADDAILDGTIEKKNPDGSTAYSAVYASGSLVSYTDAAGDVFTFDGQGNLTALKKRLANGEFATYRYTAGLVTIATVPIEEQAGLENSDPVRIEYDLVSGERRIAYLETKDGHYKIFTYGNNGIEVSEGVMRVVDAEKLRTSERRKRYDRDRRLLSVEDTDGLSVSYEYKDDGSLLRVLAVKDGNTYVYEEGQLVKVLSPEGLERRYYDSGLLKRSESTPGDFRDYAYGTDQEMRFAAAELLASGSFDGVAYEERSDGAAELSLERERPDYGDGSDGDLRVEAGETYSIDGPKQYRSIYVAPGATLTVAPWNGVTGGAIDIRCAGDMVVEGSIETNKKGYRGGAGFVPAAAGAPACSMQGESYAGTPTCSTVANGGGGGGAVAMYVSAMRPFGQSVYINVTGGAGGSYGSIGDPGTNYYVASNYMGADPYSTSAGALYGDSGSQVFYRGSGGGGGISGAAGGNGGGSIRIAARTVTVSGTISANGGNGTSGSGGGSGGSVWILGGSVDISGSIAANGGTGEPYVVNNATIYGGKGGDGRIRIDHADLAVSGIVGPEPYYNRYVYASEGSFESPVMEADAAVFHEFSWEGAFPTGTSVILETCAGNTPMRDDSWTGWSPGLADATGSRIPTPGARYIQFRASLGTADPYATPTLVLGGSKGMTLKYAAVREGDVSPADASLIQITHHGAVSLYWMNGKSIESSADSIDISYLNLDAALAGQLIERAQGFYAAGLDLDPGAGRALAEVARTRWTGALDASDLSRVAPDEPVMLVYETATDDPKSEKRVLQYQKKTGDTVVFAYDLDEEGKVVSTVTNDGTSKTIYDADHTIVKTVILPTDDDPSASVSEYEYGKLRRIYKGGALVCRYSYEYDADGAETVVVTDLKAGSVKHFTGERLLSVTDKDGLHTAYEYDATGRISRSTVTRSGKLVGRYDYAYEGDLTRMTDADGVVRAYDADNRLVSMRKDGTTYAYRYAVDPLGREVVTQEFVGATDALPDSAILRTDAMTADMIDSVSMADGTIINYFNTKPVLIIVPDVMRVENIALERYGASVSDYRIEGGSLVGYTDPARDAVIVSFTATDDAGNAYVFEENELVRKVRADGVVVAGPSPDEFSALALSLVKAAFDPDSIAGQKTYRKADLSITLTKDNKVSCFIDGRMSSTFQKDGTGKLTLMMEYSYDAEGDLILVRLPHARDAVEAQMAEARSQIAAEKAAYLRSLSAQKGLGCEQIEGQAAPIRAQIDAERARLRPYLYQEVTRSEWVGFWIFGWWETYKETVEVPEVRNALNQLAEQERQLNLTVADAYAQLNAEVGAALAGLDRDEETALAGITGQETAFQAQIIEQETVPVLLEYYRKILGRDPDDAETVSWLEKVGYHGKIDVAELVRSLTAMAERADQDALVGWLKENVAGKLNEYLGASAEGRRAILTGLGFTAEEIDVDKEIVGLTGTEISGIVGFLGRQNIHFGKSAFTSLEYLLSESGIPVARNELALRTILVDIFTGAINSLSEGELLEISMYSLAKVASSYGLTLYNAKIGFDELSRAFNEGSKVIAHFKNDHFVVVTGIGSDGTVSYVEVNRGREGHLWTVSKEGFLDSWTGYTIQKVPPQDETKRVSTWQAQRVKGSCLPLLLPLIGFIAGTVAAFAAGVIAAIATVVATIGTIIGSIMTGIGALLSGVAHFMGGMGAAVFSAVKFVGISLVKGVGAFLGGALFGSAAATTATGGLSATLTTLGVSLAKTVVMTALSFGVQKGFDAIGLDPHLAPYLTSFITGSVHGLLTGGGPIGLIVGGVQGLAMQGASAACASFGLPLEISSLIGMTASSAVSAGFTGLDVIQVVDGIEQVVHLSGLDAIGHAMRTTIMPTIASELFSVGITRMGSVVGLDPLVLQLAGGATRGFIRTALLPGFRAEDLILAVKNAATSAVVSVGVSLLDGINPAAGPILRSTGLIGAVETMLGSAGLFDGVFSVLNRIVPTAFNTASTMVTSFFGNAKTFVELVTERDSLGAMNEVLNSLFTRQTVEAVIAQGGVEAVLARPSTEVVLPDGSIVHQIVITENASIYLNDAGELISVKEGGVTSTGSFAWTSDNGLSLRCGVVTGTMETGYGIVAEIDNEIVKNIEISDPSGSQVAKIDPDAPAGSIRINSAWNPAISEFSYIIANATLYYANAYRAVIRQETVESLTQKINAISAGSLFNDTNTFLYALANGIRNPERDPIRSPAYIYNLEQDLVARSDCDISSDDMIELPLYQGMAFLPSADCIIDMLNWVIETQTTYQTSLALQVLMSLNSYFSEHLSYWNRPIIGMGYSGGFMPLIEAASRSMYNIETIVGLGGPSAYLNAQTAGRLIKLLRYVTDGLLGVAGSLLREWGFDDSFAGRFISAVQNSSDELYSLVGNILEKRGAISSIGVNPVAPSPLKADLIVNVWGTEDDFYKIGVVGKRENMFGKVTYNIEIVGATHTDYIRRLESDTGNPPDIWNNTVADFVAELILNSDNATKLLNFFSRNRDKVSYDDKRGVYIVNLPGFGVEQ